MLEIASGELPGHVRLLQLPSVEVEVHVRYSSDWFNYGKCPEIENNVNVSWITPYNKIMSLMSFVVLQLFVNNSVFIYSLCTRHFHSLALYVLNQWEAKVIGLPVWRKGNKLLLIKACCCGYTHGGKPFHYPSSFISLKKITNLFLIGLLHQTNRP